VFASCGFSARGQDGQVATPTIISRTADAEVLVYFIENMGLSPGRELV
jgi:hypothetical protein